MLALKYRPSKFQDLVGQEHIVRVLASIIRKHFKGSALPAAFIFAGSRGTGKTTSARIVAALLNCEDNLTTLTPCGKCEACVTVFRSSCLFVHEIDAASAGLVDDIRKIKEIATLAHSGKVRVVILDEAHSLSKSAFEALLKQLEEPLPNVLYVMCTTELNKFPETILSRAMIFTFKEIVPELIVSRLTQIVIAEEIAVKDSRILQAIALKAQGALRDSITMLEQISNFKSDLTLADFQEYYGLVGTEVCATMVELAKKADIVGARELIRSNFSRSIDMTYFLDTFMQVITELLHSHSMTAQQAVEAYRAAVEVKGKLRHVSTFIAVNYLFALMLRVFAYEGKQATVATKQQLQQVFG